MLENSVCWVYDLRRPRKPRMRLLLPNIDWNSLMSGLIGAVVGGLIAAASTMWAAGRSTKQAFNYSRSLQDEAERETLRRLLLAIRTEIATTWEAYESEAGRHVNSLDYQPLQLRYDLRQQYFTVYDSNAQFLGHIENDELRSAIVRAYTLFKRLIDVHLLNNDLRERHNEVIKSRGADPYGYAWRQFNESVQRAFDEWQEFGGEVKKAYLETKNSVADLLKLLDKSALPEEQSSPEK